MSPNKFKMVRRHFLDVVSVLLKKKILLTGTSKLIEKVSFRNNEPGTASDKKPQQHTGSIGYSLISRVSSYWDTDMLKLDLILLFYSINK
jgi:hypothetical protein